MENLLARKLNYYCNYNGNITVINCFINFIMILMWFIVAMVIFFNVKLAMALCLSTFVVVSTAKLILTIYIIINEIFIWKN